MPQMSDAASVLPSISSRYVRWMARAAVGMAARATVRRARAASHTAGRSPGDPLPGRDLLAHPRPDGLDRVPVVDVHAGRHAAVRRGPERLEAGDVRLAGQLQAI